MVDLAFEPAHVLARKLRRREISSEELMRLYLDRIARHNPKINAVVVIDGDKALTEAREADRELARGEVRGPLHGLPMTVKESYDVAGWKTTWGNPAWKDNVAIADAAVVERLKRAGAIVFGKTNVPLLLGDFQSANEIYGRTNNPWNLERVPGGSSGGSSAALAAGLTGLEAGSDIGGSLRNPAHYTGTYAHKPSYGIVPTRGQMPPGIVGAGDLSVVGPMGRAAEDLDLELGLIAGADGAEASVWKLDLRPTVADGFKGLRVAVWADDPRSPVDAAVGDRLQAAVEAIARAGATVDDKARPDFDVELAHTTYLRLLRGTTAARQPKDVFEGYLKKLPTLSDGDRGYYATVIRGATLYHRDWIGWNETRAKLRRAWARFFESWDVLIAPVAPTTAFPHNGEPDRDKRFLPINGKPVAYSNQLFWAGLPIMPFLPATAAPAGLARDGLPSGLQIIGAFGQDRTTIAVSQWLERLIGGFVPPSGWS
ncbi:MAG: amidase [Alphaproteobacteria bacterium]|nr:amidase [Alphaproteobacteria bacterium]